MSADGMNTRVIEQIDDALKTEAYRFHVSDELWDYVKYLRIDEAKLRVPDDRKGATGGHVAQAFRQVPSPQPLCFDTGDDEIE